MPDLLVNLLKLPPLERSLAEVADANINIRRAQPFEITPVRQFIEKNFSVAWADEISVGFTNKPVTVKAADGEESPEALMVRAFQEAGYICFLTVGGKENRAWPIRKGLTAWDAAGSIHTDIQKGFIRAEIISFADFLEAGGETQAKRAGKLRLELKQYVMQDCDLTNFRFNK